MRPLAHPTPQTDLTPPWRLTVWALLLGFPPQVLVLVPHLAKARLVLLLVLLEDSDMPNMCCWHDCTGAAHGHLSARSQHCNCGRC